MTPQRSIAAVAACLALILTAALGASSQAPKEAAKSKVLESLQGSWLFTSADGQDLTGSGQEIYVTITGNAYVQTINGQQVERGTFRIDETKKPMTLDLIIAEGDDAGQTQLGVLQIDGKTIWGKLAQPGMTARPTDFAPADGYFVFAAVKKS